MNFTEQEENSLTPEQKEMVYKSVLDRYKAEAGNDAEIQAAQDKARKQQGMIGLAQGIAALGAAQAGSGRTDTTRMQNQDYWSGLKRSSENQVADAKAAKSEKLKNILAEDEIGWKDQTRERQQKEWGDQDALRAREDDPTSQESRTAQALAKKMMPGKDFSNMTAKQLKSSIPTMEKMYSIDQQRLTRQDQQSERQARENEKRADKEKERDDKKKQVVMEVEDRRRNIEDNLTSLEQMIEENGTYEMFGSHNQDLDRKVEAIATDMAKLTDPSSVARPSEVEAVKKNLIQSGFQNKNATAKDILKNFRSEVNKRASNAYKIRGLEDPGSEKTRQQPGSVLSADDLPEV